MALDLTATNPAFPLGMRILYLDTMSFFRSWGMSHSSNIALILSDAAARLSSEFLSIPASSWATFSMRLLFWMK